MKQITNFLHTLISFVYPESETSSALRSLSPEDVCRRIPKVMDFTGLIDHDVHAVWQYQHELAKTVIHELKGSRNLHAARCAGFAVYEYLKNLKILSISAENRQLLRQPTLLIPVPLSRKRQNERGYNQCELIVKAILEIAKADSVQPEKFKFEVASDILIRGKHSAEQKTKNRVERIESSANIFTLKKSATSAANAGGIAGRTCIVIDDVATTGSTLVAARNILHEAGAAQVILIAVAH